MISVIKISHGFTEIAKGYLSGLTIGYRLSITYGDLVLEMYATDNIEYASTKTTINNETDLSAILLDVRELEVMLGNLRAEITDAFLRKNQEKVDGR